ncbi:MAG: ATP-dependent Clp protease adapter ClpS [Actinomycetota bacterium]|jgi:ATP-dependent Clp protease adaptor protein ClpS
MPQLQPLVRPSTDNQTSSSDAAATAKAWNVVVWDDPVTPMPVVVAILRKIFAFPNAKATRLMMTVHHEGRAIVWSGQRDRAEAYCVQLHVAGLQATIEQDS